MTTRPQHLVTKTSVVLCYDFLRSLHPFKSWNLPKEIDVSVTDKTDEFGSYTEPNEIAISRLLVWDYQMLIRVVAHEMIHARQHVLGQDPDHGKSFWVHAREVCTAFGWHQEDI